MKLVKLFPLLLLGIVVFVSGCVEKEKTETEKIKQICIKACEDAVKERDLSAGPCLLNPMPEYPDWVCDVAHSPRQDVDNLEENQCSAFREGRAKHFVEVTPECKFIKSY